MDYAVAICIPTYGRSELVNDFLVNCGKLYTDAGIDIYFYDSSADGATERIVRQWEGDGIFYIRLPSDTFINDKMVRIFQGSDWKKPYDFVSLSNDATQYSQEDLARILGSLDPALDFIVYDSLPDEGPRIYTDPNAFLRCKCEAYHIGASMLNVHTMLRAIDWGVYGEKLHRYGEFSFYFHRFAELESFRALHLEIVTRRISAYKKQSFYNGDMIYHGVQNALDVYGTLPEIYTDRWLACRQFTTEAYFRNAGDFLLYRRQGVYTKERFLQYRDDWEKVTDVPLRRLERIADLPRETLEAHYRRRLERGQEKLEDFFAAHRTVAVYGAGNHGSAYCDYLESRGMEFAFFAVSRRKPGKYRFRDHPVAVFSEIKDRDGMGFIVALSGKNAADVLPGLVEAAGRENVFYNRPFETEMRYQMGYQAYSAI